MNIAQRILAWILASTVVVCSAYEAQSQEAIDSQSTPVAEAGSAMPSKQQLDPAFTAFVNLSLLDRAIAEFDSNLVTDLALQTYFGERMLLRECRLISAKELIIIAVEMAAHSKNGAALERLSDCVDNTKDLEFKAKVAKSIEMASVARGTSSDSVNTSDLNSKYHGMHRAFLNQIELAIVCGDRGTLEEMTSNVFPDDFPDALQTSIQEALQIARAKVPKDTPPSRVQNALAHLKGASRGSSHIDWNETTYYVFNMDTEQFELRGLRAGSNRIGIANQGSGKLLVFPETRRYVELDSDTSVVIHCDPQHGLLISNTGPASEVVFENRSWMAFRIVVVGQSNFESLAPNTSQSVLLPADSRGHYLEVDSVNTALQLENQTRGSNGTWKLGVDLSEFDPNMRGCKVDDVYSRSAAVGVLELGDWIQKVNGYPISSKRDLISRVRNAANSNAGRVTLSIQRGGQPRFEAKIQLEQANLQVDEAARYLEGSSRSSRDPQWQTGTLHRVRGQEYRIISGPSVFLDGQGYYPAVRTSDGHRLLINEYSVRESPFG